ncbi:MAG: hypothetical protein N6V49_02390, partial [Serratia symbiotica]|nr:hypothetical protein [Serratia symbiotica]
MRMTFRPRSTEYGRGVIPVILKAASLLVAFSPPRSIVHYAPGGSLRCHRDAAKVLRPSGLLDVQQQTNRIFQHIF